MTLVSFNPFEAAEDDAGSSSAGSAVRQPEQDAQAQEGAGLQDRMVHVAESLSAQTGTLSLIHI